MPRRRTSSTPTSRMRSSGASSDTASRGFPGSPSRGSISRRDRVKRSSGAGIDRWDGNGALGYLTLSAICDDVLAEGVDGARLVVASRCFPTGALGYWARRLAAGGFVALADGDLAAAAAAALGRRAADGHEPARDRDSLERRRAGRRRRVDGRRHARRRDRRARAARGARALRRPARPQGLRARRRARAARLRTRRPGALGRAARRCARSTTRCRRSAPSQSGVRLPGDA